uniref:ATP synthase F0 subunit 6 n=1 Tax=Tetrameres grusi TaxID=1911024 RepID=UPI001FCCD6CA|nr:ATP synthase F0 subunit 6 [Tetrameres grusi]UNY39752.1 ATP synthase F0 subunit 6 [Tetrameres grusi]
MSLFFWLFVFYVFYLFLIKFCCYGHLDVFFGIFKEGFRHFGLQSVFFFNFSVFLLVIFWFCGLFFPLFSPWSCIGFLFFLTNFSWLGVRMFSLLSFGFMVFFEEENSWGWFTSLVMFVSHLLSFFMSGLALTLRISIIFLIGHFLVFFLIDLNFLLSFFLLLLVLPLELFFAFLQSYIFLTLICMFLLNMI